MLCHLRPLVLSVVLGFYHKTRSAPVYQISANRALNNFIHHKSRSNEYKVYKHKT